MTLQDLLISEVISVLQVVEMSKPDVHAEDPLLYVFPEDGKLAISLIGN
jgi:hypothetical protein